MAGAFSQSDTDHQTPWPKCSILKMVLRGFWAVIPITFAASTASKHGYLAVWGLGGAGSLCSCGFLRCCPLRVKAGRGKQRRRRFAQRVLKLHRTACMAHAMGINVVV